jgi:hypothetical protein
MRRFGFGSLRPAHLAVLLVVVVFAGAKAYDLAQQRRTSPFSAAKRGRTLGGFHALRDQLVGRAIADHKSSLHGADQSAVVVRDGRMMLRKQPGIGETYSEVLQRNILEDVDALGSWNPIGFGTGYAMTTFGAQFAASLRRSPSMRTSDSFASGGWSAPSRRGAS